LNLHSWSDEGQKRRYYLLQALSRQYIIEMSVIKKLIPLADRVLIRRVVAQTKTAGGIILPESSVSKNNEGQVVAIGPGATTRSGEVIPITVAVGDKVLLPEYGGLGVKLDGEEVFLFRNDEILAKFAA
jgi:chaperonin GroES